MAKGAESEILSQLRASAPNWVTGEILRSRDGVSRAAISKRIRKLQELGYRIESSPRKGYRLLEEPGELDAQDMAVHLGGSSFYRFPFLLKEVTASTNDDVRALAAAGAPEGTVVFAEVQREGRGRRGRFWYARAGDALQFSLLLRPPVSPGEGTLIPLMAATAVCRGLRRLGLEEVGIKWPNDVLISGRKVCGILCEMSVNMEGIEYAMLGIGLNVSTPAEGFPEEIRDSACSLASATGKAWNRREVWVAVLRELEPLVSRLWSGDREGVLAGWRDGSVTLGRDVRVVTGNGASVSGRAEGVNAEGALEVRLVDGTLRAFHSGEVSLRTPRAE